MKFLKVLNIILEVCCEQDYCISFHAFLAYLNFGWSDVTDELSVTQLLEWASKAM